MEKKFEEPTVEDTKKIKLEFAPGCFDNFEGTQEELDGLINEITQLFETGEFFEKSKPLDIDALYKEDPWLYDQLISKLDNISIDQRNVH
jgi:hypothetical protein